MTAATAPSPGRPAIDTAELFEPDRRDWLRLLGGVLLAAGAAVLYIRKFQPWGEFLKFLDVLIPFVVLYGLGWLPGMRARAGAPAAAQGPAAGGDGALARVAAVLGRRDAAARPEGWQIVYLILGTVLSGFVVAQLFLVLGADDVRARLHQVVIAAAVAAAAYAASFLRNIPFLSIVGGIAALWAWLTLWDKIVGIDKIGTGRAFLLIFAALILAAAVALRSADLPQAGDFITVAGIAAILAGLLSVSNLANQFDPLSDNTTKPTELWNVFILVVSLALIAYGSRAPTRGPSWVGALGLLAFVGLTGANVVALANGHLEDREKLAGWPLLLLVLGIGGLVASFFVPREGAAPRGPATTPEGGPGGARPGAGYGPPPGQYGVPGRQAPGGGYAAPVQQPPAPGGGYQQPPPAQQPPAQPSQPEAWPPPGGQTVARPVPPTAPPPGGETVARPVPPPPGGQQPGQSPQDRPTDPGYPRPPGR